MIVKNTGDVPGKQVVQVYAEAPQGKLGKAARSLCAFKKTAELQPGESEAVEIAFEIAKLASYDDSGVTGHKSAYVLEAGTYNIYTGACVRCASLSGSFEIAPEGSVNLGWSGVGQYHDLITPCAMLRYVGAIANGGKAVEPVLLDKVTTSSGLPLWFDLFRNKDRLLKSDTAAQLKEMMAYCVRENYGVESFPGLPMCAKSGTAEVESGASPHAWFTGFINSEEHPYAFVVLVENGGAGSTVAGSIANTVLQAVVADD